MSGNLKPNEPKYDLKLQFRTFAGEKIESIVKIQTKKTDPAILNRVFAEILKRIEIEELAKNPEQKVCQPFP